MRYARKTFILMIAAALTLGFVPTASAASIGAAFMRPVITPQAAKPAVVHPAFSRAAGDMVGFEPSLYRGQWYDKSAESTRKCIMFRESRFHYRTQNPTSSAAGAYQFLDRPWRLPLTYMMIDEERSLPGKPNKQIINEIRDLRNTNIANWNRYWQDRAFWTAWRFGAGAKHWYHPGIRCF